MKKIKPILLGCEGLTLGPEEAEAFAAVNPLGFILFARNCGDPAQLMALTAALRRAVGRPDAPIFIDQEGGRVARLKPPHWAALPPARTLGLIAERDLELGRRAATLHARLAAQMLKSCGIDGNCAPVLDLLIDGATSAIGDRSFGREPEIITALGRAMVEEMLRGGVYPVIKHCPGHGRACVDPHLELPFVDADIASLNARDFAPFAALRDAPMAMTGHVVYRAIDPENPASLSVLVHEKIIRGALGFQGLILTDDLAMGALKMPLETRVRRAFDAGADIALYCTGSLMGLRTIAPHLPVLSGTAQARLEAAAAQREHAFARVPADAASLAEDRRVFEEILTEESAAAL